MYSLIDLSMKDFCTKTKEFTLFDIKLVSDFFTAACSEVETNMLKAKMREEELDAKELNQFITNSCVVIKAIEDKISYLEFLVGEKSQPR